MKIKSNLKILSLLIIFSGLAAIISYFVLSSRPNSTTPEITVADKLFGWKFPVAKFPITGTHGKLIAYSSIRDPGGIPRGLPIRLKIPTIGVDSAIEDALITPDGRMDVPVGSVNVAWFSLGPHPGDQGSAVIGGHFGIEKGLPFVFYNLDKLKIGDKIYIVNDKNDTLAFMVREIKSFDRNADSTTVFTSGDGIAHLNLITCEGIWNQVNGNYPLRLVIFTDAIPGEGAITVSPSKVANTTQVTPAVVTPPVEPANLPAVGIAAAPPPTSSQVLIASAKSLYASPLDGLITSFLFFSILFVTLKLIRLRIKLLRRNGFFLWPT